MWHLTACKISSSLSFFNWIKNEMIVYCISELMLATLIQRYDKKSFCFKNERLIKFYRLSGATFYDFAHTIYQFNMNLIGAIYIRASKLSSNAS